MFLYRFIRNSLLFDFVFMNIYDWFDYFKLSVFFQHFFLLIFAWKVWDKIFLLKINNPLN